MPATRDESRSSTDSTSRYRARFLDDVLVPVDHRDDALGRAHAAAVVGEELGDVVRDEVERTAIRLRQLDALHDFSAPEK